ncbi:MAG TPA: methionine--tRNA ligase subunit beta, partial [Methanoregula sp.]|nr:methionine--tRNA ligase subunit beta [Methanoregula sp.]
NFVYRTLYFAQKEFGCIPPGTTDPAIMAEIEKSLAALDQLMRDYEFKGAVDAIMALAAFGNTYIQTNAPWKLIKTDRDAAARVIRNSAQIAKALAVLIEPVMPESAQQCWTQLGYTDRVADHPISDAKSPVTAGPLSPPVPLFVKMEDPQIKDLDALLQKRVAEANRKTEKIPMVTFEEFQKLDIRTGKILSAELVPKSNKLLKLMVDIGSDKRQIVAGMQQFYTPDEMVGKDVVVVTNLAPAKIFGVESNGMILAAGDAASLLVPLKPVEPGTKIR